MLASDYEISVHSPWGEIYNTTGYNQNPSRIHEVPRKAATMNVKVILELSENDGFTAIVPALPGCISEGNTREDALRNIREAIELHLEPVEDDAPHYQPNRGFPSDEGNELVHSHS